MKIISIIVYQSIKKVWVVNNARFLTDLIIKVYNPLITHALVKVNSFHADMRQLYTYNLLQDYNSLTKKTVSWCEVYIY